MKQILLTVFAVLYTSAIYAQSFNPTTQRDSILNQIYEDVGLIKFNQEEFGRYKIYQTDNIHILLKLDTATGIIKMLQWNLDRDKEFEVFINTERLTEGGLAKKADLSYIQPRTCISLYCLTRSWDLLGMFSGELKKANIG